MKPDKNNCPVAKIHLFYGCIRIILWAALVTLGGVSACVDKTNSTTKASSSESEAPGPQAPVEPWLKLNTELGTYQIEVVKNYAAVPPGKIHYWDFEISDANNQPITVERFELSGDMPGHGHGMTTFPQPTMGDEAGKIRVKGIKFHMSGHWRMRISLDGPNGKDKVLFDIELAPEKIATAERVVHFTSAEIAQLKALHLSNLPRYRGDASNRFSLNPLAVELGAKLFFDKGLSANNDISCASCHQPDRFFSDGKAKGMGSEETKRHTPSLIGVARHRWFYWDGRRDSLWAQAVTPIETLGEMDNTRVDALRFVFDHPEYGPAFEKLTRHNRTILSGLSDIQGTGPLSDGDGRKRWLKLHAPAQERINHAFADLGKMLAAYEETLTPAASTLEAFVDALIEENENKANDLLSPSALRGARLFVDNRQTQCLRCHNGPLLTNREFHNIATGMGSNKLMDFGRAIGFKEVQENEFNCTSIYSDAPADGCGMLRFVRRSHLDNGAFKTPSLRHVSKTAPYMHDGRFATLREVVDHYRRPVADFTAEHEMPPLNLSDDEANDLVEFLKIL